MDKAQINGHSIRDPFHENPESAFTGLRKEEEMFLHRLPVLLPAPETQTQSFAAEKQVLMARETQS